VVNDGFICAPDASGPDAGKTFEPCYSTNGCDPGLGCFGPASANKCDPAAMGCCLPFCDLKAVDDCPNVGKGLTCQALFEPGTAFENVGVCALPA
jgi:hypothetical protein